MEGGTTFHFVTGGIRAALDARREAAKGQDVRLGGGVATIRQYLEAGLIDEMHLAISPILLGSGEHLFANHRYSRPGLPLHRARGHSWSDALRSDKAAW